MTDERLALLVSQFAAAVAAQTENLRSGDHKNGNAEARKYIKAFKQLAAHGDAGRDALAELFEHPMAAAYLLRYKHDEAMAILRRESEGKGLAAFGAGECIKRWNSGEWHLDE